jgi:hypothetical protein
LVTRQKLNAVSKVHLYSVHIKSRQEHENQTHEFDNHELAKPQALPSIRHKLQRNSLGVFLLKEIFVKNDTKIILKRFIDWKFKTNLFEWRMN